MLTEQKRRASEPADVINAFDSVTVSDYNL